MDDWFKDDFRSEVKTQLMSNIQIHFLGQYNWHCSGWTPASVQLQLLLTISQRHAGLSTADQDESWKAFLFRVLEASPARWIDGVMDSGLRPRRYLIDAPLSQERNSVNNVCSTVSETGLAAGQPSSKRLLSITVVRRLCFVLFCFPSVIKEEWKC